jgi:iron complex outermembrane receptor protein
MGGISALALGIASPLAAQNTTKPDADASGDAAANDIVVTGSLNALPLKDVGSVFGFGKTLLETPRSASTISKEQMDRFGATNIYDLVAQSPGTFTNSFFGVGGALDIRGTPGEVYFRGMRRLDNPGNYPTPIGASDRIDIVRGPASPIMGPSKTGGYMNFVPRSARGANGELLSKTEGEMSYTRGSWDENVLKASIRGPAKIGSAEFGYNLYGQIDNDGSYYRNMSTHQTIVQASFDADLTSNLRVEFGGMYQDYKGQQNGGWNRLTQALVDNGTYITGTAKSLDSNGDGQISRSEARAANGGQGLTIFGTFGCSGGIGNPTLATSFTDACLISSYNGAKGLDLVNPGTTTLSRRDTLTGPNDVLRNKQTTGYFDLIYDGANDLQIKNQLFYDGTRNINNNDYGFSQFVKSWVIEDKIVADKKFQTSIGTFDFQVSPSIRYTKFHFGDDFDIEEFHRVDLTQSYTPLSNRLLSNECGCNYNDYLRGHYTDYGLAALTDLNFDFGLDVILGGRYDYVKAKSTVDPTKVDPVDLPATLSASGHDGGWSWNASASYKLPFGLIPYVTASNQATIVVGEGSEIAPSAIAAGGTGFIAISKLYEGGIKGEFLNKRLYAALSVYKQTRTDHNVQSAVTNQSVETKGVEAEVRWSVDRHLLVTGAYTRTKVYNLTGIDDKTLFSFFGIEDLVNVKDPTLYLGGQLIGLVPITNKEQSRRAGIPTNLYSATGTYAFDNGIAVNASVTHVDSVFSGQSQVVKLPAYTLVDLGASYTTGPWLLRLVVKNATDAKYFRANFTELFGSTIVLPEKPRSFQVTLQYKF